jgi:hypothetical protein
MSNPRLLLLMSSVRVIKTNLVGRAAAVAGPWRL